MRKILLIPFLGISLYSGEFQIGKGDMSFTGGMMGLTQTISENITSYSLISNHSNIGNSKVFYAYNFTWYDSEHMKQLQQTYNTGITQINNFFSPYNNFMSQNFMNQKIYIPTMDYRLQGLDAAISLGYDFINNGENNYLGIAGYLGISTPWISATKGNDILPVSLPKTTKNNILYNFYKNSKTKIKTYKLGVALYSRVNIAPSLSGYFNWIYAHQTGSISNDYAKSDFHVNGDFISFDIGMRFQPYEKNFDLGLFTLSPRLFATIGYRYNSWTYDDASINISGMPTVKFPKTTMKIKTDMAYLGVGYSF